MKHPLCIQDLHQNDRRDITPPPTKPINNLTHLRPIAQVYIPWAHVCRALVLVLVNSTAKYEAKSPQDNTPCFKKPPYAKVFDLTPRNRTPRPLDSSTTILTAPSTDPIIGTPSARRISLIRSLSEERGKRWREYATPCLSKWGVHGPLASLSREEKSQN